LKKKDNAKIQAEVVKRCKALRADYPHEPANAPRWDERLKLDVQKLARLDVTVLVETLYEQKRCGKWQIIFPGPDFESYLPILPLNNKSKLLALIRQQNRVLPPYLSFSLEVSF